MTYGQLQDGIYRLTEDEIKELARFIPSVYKGSIKAIEAELAKVYANLAGINSADSGYYKYMLERGRLEKALKAVKSEYTTYSAQVQRIIENVISIAASNAYYRSMYASGWLVDAYKAIPYNLVELIVYGTAEAWKNIPKNIQAVYGDLAQYVQKAGTLTEFVLNNRADEIAQIQKAIIQGLQSGQSYAQMSASIKAVIGSVVKKDGALTASGAVANALRIVATESSRAMNAANLASMNFLASEGFDVMKQWNATLDSSTRSAHAALDGKRVPIDQPFPGGAMAPGQWPTVGQNCNCRCSLLTILDGGNPALRTGRNPITGEQETFEWSYFDDWAKERGLTTNKYGELYVKT